MTDHRQQAEHWLTQFLDSIGPVQPTRGDMLRLATIHALLAGLPAPPDTRWGPEVVLTKAQSDAIHAILNSPSED